MIASRILKQIAISRALMDKEIAFLQSDSHQIHWSQKVREVLEASSAAPGNRSGQGRGAE